MEFLYNDLYSVCFRIYISVVLVKAYIEVKDNRISLWLLSGLRLLLLVYKDL